MLQNINKKHKGIKYILLFWTIPVLFFAFLFSSKSFASPALKDLPPCIQAKPELHSFIPTLQINKDLTLSVNTPHLLAFDEKIVRYKFENEKDYRAEILSNIFNPRQELLIKPLKSLNNNLTVWTESKIYNIKILFEQNQESAIHENSINKTPVLSEDTSGMTDFELDSPPEIKKSN